MLAAYHGHGSLVRFLIQHGADPNRLNDRRQSPLAGAVFKKEDDVIDVSSDSFMIIAGLGLQKRASPPPGGILNPAPKNGTTGIFSSFFCHLPIFLWSTFSANTHTGFVRRRCRSGVWHAVGYGVRRHVQAGGDVESEIRIRSRSRKRQHWGQ